MFNYDEEIGFPEPNGEVEEEDLSMFIIADLENEMVGDMTFETRIKNQLEEIRDKIQTLNLEDLPQIKRFGLAKLPKDYLFQYLLFLEGLYHLKVLRDKDKAIEKLLESLTKVERFNNELCRRALLRLHELFSEKLTTVKIPPPIQRD